MNDSYHYFKHVSHLTLVLRNIAMNETLMLRVSEDKKPQYCKPSLCIILPFEPKMTSKKTIHNSIISVYEKVEGELMENDHHELGMLVLQKLRIILAGLDYNTYKKSVAIYLSPVFEKVLYLDSVLEQKILINESFEIRDLVYSKKELHEYLVLLLNNNESRIYVANSDNFIMIVTDKAQPDIDVPERVANFSDTSERKEIVMDKFLHHIDNTLNIVLNSYHLPLFVAGAERITGHFKKYTRHRSAIIKYIHANYEDPCLPQLKKVLEPHIADWKNIMQKDLLNKMEDAAGKKKLAVGIRDVWKEAMKHNGHLLIVEKNYTHGSEPVSIDEVIYKAVEPYPSFSYIKDEVDDIIEKVLENGGDVVFADKEIMSNYQHIAMIQYY